MKKLINLSMLVLIVLQSMAPAMTVLAKEADAVRASVLAQEANPTVEPSLKSDQTPSPTVESDPVTSQSTETPVVESTPVPTETPEPTSTATPEITATPVVTETVVVEESDNLEAQQYTISLESNPAFITRSGNLSVSWGIPELEGETDPGLQLFFAFSAGIVPDLKEKQDGVFDAETMSYILPATARGQVKLNVSEEAEAPFFVQAALVRDEQVVGSALLNLPERTMMSQKGGSVDAFNGKLKIHFPKGAVPADAEVLVGVPVDEKISAGGLQGMPFEITVFTLSSGKDDQSLESRAVKKFEEPLVIELSYDENAIRGDERDLQLFYWNTEVGSWFTVPSQVNTETNTLVGYSDHLTVFGMGINDFEVAKVPTLKGFQVSEFTGAATYSYPLDLPAGPGGLQPQLALNYNSQVVDQATGSTQASWVGFGWSMATLGIERNMHGTNFNEPDDTFSLTLNGVGGMLLPGEDGYYHTSDESFVRVLQCPDGSCWSAWDKAGNQYYFGDRAAIARVSCETGNNDCAIDWLTWRWSLSWMENIHGQRLVYQYKVQTDGLEYRECNQHGENCRNKSASTTQAVYPQSILYPDNRTRIWFDYSTDGERKDYESSWTGTNTLHQRYFLKSISVQRNVDNSNPDFEMTIRKYELAYETDPAKLVLPSIEWNNGQTPKGRNLTLKSITEKGLGGSQSLPATTFTYGDKMHLTEANNGYGGRVVFTYETNPWHAPEASIARTVEHIYRPGGNYCTKNGKEEFGGWLALGADLSCWGALYVPSPGAGNFSFADPQLSRAYTKPGAYYRLVSNISALSGGTYAQLGFGRDGVVALARDISSTPIQFDEAILFASGGTIGEVYVFTDGAALADFKFQLLPTFYRVMKKEIFDGRQASAQEVLTYEYEGASMNTPEKSAAAGTAHPYNEAYSEFRGHETVTVTRLDGTKTETTYCQSDDCTGKPLAVEISSGGVPLRETVYEYQNAPSPIALSSGFQPLIQVVPLVGNPTWPHATGLGIQWNYTGAVTSKVYASDGTSSTTREVYTYETDKNNAGYGNRKEVTSQYLESVHGVDIWVPHIRTVMNYLCIEPDYYSSCQSLENYVSTYNAYGFYLTGLVTKVKQFDTKRTSTPDDDEALTTVVYLYDGNTGGYMYPVVPAGGGKPGKLTSVRAAVKLEAPNYSQVSYGYDAWGNRVSEMAWSGYGTWETPPASGARTTTIEYDTVYHTYPVKSKDPLNFETTWAYDYSLGLPTSEIDLNGQETKAAYDSFGRMTQLARPGDVINASPTLKIAYFVGGSVCGGAPFCVELSQHISGTQYYTLRRFYDGMGRQFRTQTGSTQNGSFALYNTVDTIFDSATQTRQSVPYGPAETPVYTTTVSAFSGGKQITTVTAPDGSVTRSEVDGLTTTVTDPALHETISQADRWGQVIKVTPETGPVVGYVYSLTGQLTHAIRASEALVDGCLADPDRGCPTGSTVRLGYDMAGRKISMNDPDMGSWTYTYDALGNLKTQTDARNCTLTLEYDVLNRLTHKGSSGACGSQVNTTYLYDQWINSTGHRSRMYDTSGVTTWYYDQRGRVIKEAKFIDGQSGSTPLTTEWTYNSADLPLTMTYPDGEVVTSTYTPQMMLDTLKGDSTYVFGTQYDFAGRMTSRGLGQDQDGPAQPIFSDVPAGYWAQQQIDGLYTRGIISACASGPLRYCPETNVTRADIARDLLRAKYGAAYIPPTPTSQRFSDVPSTHWAYAWIDKFAADGITAGCGTGTFCPNDAVTRIQIVIFLLRVKYGSTYAPPAVPANGHIFTDMIGNGLEAWAVDAYNKGITTGCGNGNFCPNATVNRATEAVFIENTFDFIPAAPPAPQAVVAQNYTYYGWTEKVGIVGQGGRLKNLTAAGLQNLTYQYDKVGNMGQIADLVNSETQSFGYDALDRLTSASASGSPFGAYSETYSYDASTGNLADKAGTTLTYAASGHAHAVSSTSGGGSYGYDANGNQTTRTIGGQTYTLIYDAENRLVEVKKGVPVIAAFTYDGDGRQVKSVINGVTTLYYGAHYEVKNQQVTKYYFAGASRVAMRRYTVPVEMNVEYLLGDHLGSTSLTVDSTGAKTSELRYKAWGELRYAWVDPNLNTSPAYRLTDYTFTGQRSFMDDPTTTATEGFGLMFYNARWYDAALGRFTQADSIVPRGAQGLDRYAYVNNSPVVYTDPSGHKACLDTDEEGKCIPEPKHSFYDDLTDDGKVMFRYFAHLLNKYPGLSIVEFFGLMTMYEINGNPKAEPWIIESAADQLFTPNHGKGTPNPYCPNAKASCIAGIYNYLGTYSESAMKHATPDSKGHWNDGPPPLLANSSGDLLTDAKNIGAQIMSQQGKHPQFMGIHYGNGPSWLDAARARSSFGSGVTQVLTIDESFVAYKIYQENFWICVTDNNYNKCAREYGLNPKKPR